MEVRGAPVVAAFCSWGTVGGHDAAENLGSYSAHLAEHMRLDGSFEGAGEVDGLAGVRVVQVEPGYKDYRSTGQEDLVNLVKK